jgi:hypothetical protein
MMYKYSELQVFSTNQKLNCKVICKTPFLFIVNEFMGGLDAIMISDFYQIVGGIMWRGLWTLDGFMNDADKIFEDFAKTTQKD